MPGLHITYLPLGALTRNARNARTHSRKQIRQIAAYIQEFGFTNPILIDNENMVLAGHGRLAAARSLNMEKVPCIRIEEMSLAQKRAYALADNKLALNAGWDEEILAQELESLLNIDPAFDISITGFSIAETDSLIEGLKVEEPGDPKDDELPALGGAKLCKPGDLWQLGPHRLICGDALNKTAVEALMKGEKAQMVFTDPPYNVPIKQYVSGHGSVQHNDFAMASGEMSKEEFTAFLRTAFDNLSHHSSDGSIHFISMGWRHMEEILAAGAKVYEELKNLIVWVKANGGLGKFYRSRHELIFVFKKGSAPHITASNWASMGAIAPTSGNIGASAASRRSGWTNFSSIRPSSRFK